MGLIRPSSTTLTCCLKTEAIRVTGGVEEPWNAHAARRECVLVTATIFACRADLAATKGWTRFVAVLEVGCSASQLSDLPFNRIPRWQVAEESGLV